MELEFHQITQDYSWQPSLSIVEIRNLVFASLNSLDLHHPINNTGPINNSGPINNRGPSKDKGRVVLGFGSRGIPNYLAVCQATVEFFKERGWEVAGMAAMGTHGGDEAAAELSLLSSRHGITSDSLGGIELLSGVETQRIGETPRGISVFLPKVVLEYGGLIVPVNRIKPHTHTTRSSWQGRTLKRGSGPFKMLSIGFGKGDGAREVHAKAASFWDPIDVKNTETLGDALEEVGRFVIDQGFVLAGVGIVDNANHGTAHICALNPSTYFEDEIPWLEKSLDYLPNVPLIPDVLVIDQIGKNVSGTGAAPQVTRRWPDRRLEEDSPNIVAILRLTEETHGSAYGIGFADLTTKRLVDEIDIPFTRANTVAAGDPELGEPPVLIKNSDKEVFLEAVELAANRKNLSIDDVSILYIQDTNSLETVYFRGKKEMLKSISANRAVASVTGPKPLNFSSEGELDRDTIWLGCNKA